MKKRGPISEAMKEATKDWDVKVIAFTVELSPIAQTRHKTGLFKMSYWEIQRKAMSFKA